MKNILPYILLSLAVLTSCHKVDIGNGLVIEGESARINLTVTGDGIWTGVTKGYELNAIEEKQVKSLDILIFNSLGALVTRQRLVASPTLTNTIITRSGSGMQIYVIANVNIELNATGTPLDVLGPITKVSDLEAVKVTNLFVDIQSNKTMLMSGKVQGVTINPTNSNSVTIPLNYVAAKITVNVYSTLPVGESLTLSNWKLISLARYTYIFGRPLDAVNVANNGDFLTQVSTNTWDDGSIIIGGNATAVKTITFYVFENRRGITNNTDPTLKSGSTAPLRATKLVARGYHQHLTDVTGLDINLFFGENSVDNYNITRGYHYTYNVNVKGLNNYNVDTRYINAGVGFQAEVVNPTLDAHYDFRPLRVGAFEGSSLIEILDENRLPTTNAFWLKVSQKNITKFINNGAGVYIRPTYTASEMLQITSTVHTNPSAMESKMVYIYSDEYLVDGATRKAFIKITYTQADGIVLGSMEIPITQRGILLAGNVGMRIMTAPNILSNVNYKIGTEVIEEATISITPGNLAFERTMTMQYGFNGLQPIALNSYTLRNGYDNTISLSLSDISNGVLRPPYGRTGTATISHQFYDAIYNVYLGRYCFEKNRDTNGDGVIKGAEIKWYLPSIEEMLLIYIGGVSWSSVATDRWTLNVIYASSSQYTIAQSLGMVFATGVSGTINTTNLSYVRCVRRM